MPNPVSRFIARLCETLDVFWPAGCALLQVTLASRWLKAEGEAYEWAQYLLLGTLYPAILLAVTFLDSSWRPARRVLLPIKLTLSVFGLWVCGLYGSREADLPILAIATSYWALMLAFGAIRLRSRRGVTLLALRWRPQGGAAGSGALLDAAAGLFLVVLSWSVAVRMVWWTPFTAWVVESPYRFGIFLGASVLVAANLSRDSPRKEGPRSLASRMGNLLAIAILGLASLRADSLGGTATMHPLHEPGMTAFHHWGAIVGPAELVRRGGWLLWDVPSQYGFLSALAIAAMPLKSVWQSFYALNSILMFLSGCFVFTMYRSLRTGPTNLVFSLAVALAAVFMVPGWPYPLRPTGPYVTPAVGAYRFIWCYALLAVLVWEYRSHPRSGNHRRPLVLGSVTWLLGSLWSCESAAYCTAIWLPSYAVMLWRRALVFDPEGTRWGARARMMATWLSLPLTLLLSAWAAITAFYAARLGHGPDWRAFVDHALAAKFFSLPIDPYGNVLVQLLVFAALTTLAVTFARTSRTLGALALIGGAWGAFWATRSYFVGRSHEVNSVNLNPLLCIGVAVALFLLEREQTADRLAPLIKKALAPVFAVLLTMTFGIEPQLPRTWAAMCRGYLHKIDNSLPQMDARLSALLDAAHVRYIDPVASDENSPLPARTMGDGRRHRRRVFVHKNWAPPLVLLSPLPHERRAIYFLRFAERSQSGGWLVQNKHLEPYTKWYHSLLMDTHRMTESHDHGPWKLSRFEGNTLRR